MYVWYLQAFWVCSVLLFFTNVKVQLIDNVPGADLCLEDKSLQVSVFVLAKFTGAYMSELLHLFPTLWTCFCRGSLKPLKKTGKRVESKLAVQGVSTEKELLG